MAGAREVGRIRTWSGRPSHFGCHDPIMMADTAPNRHAAAQVQIDPVRQFGRRSRCRSTMRRAVRGDARRSLRPCALDDDASASASDEIAAARDGQRALLNERPEGIDDQRRVLVRLGGPARRAAWLILRRSGTASRVGGLWRRIEPWMPARHRLRRWLRARETKGIMALVAPPDSAIGPTDQERPGPARARAPSSPRTSAPDGSPRPTRARAHLGRGASRCGSHLCTAGNETARVHRRSSPADRRRAARCSHRPRPPPSPG